MTSGRVLVYGGKGALGSVIVQRFKSAGYWVLSVDLSENEEADVNVKLNPDSSVTEQADAVVKVTEQSLEGHKLDAIFCVAGGWAGGNAASKDFIKNCDLMWKQSVWSSTISARLAVLFLKENGLLQLTGASAALEPTTGMIGYGLAKGAVHHLVANLAASGSGLPSGASVVAILPVTLDTPMNRKWMPKADHSTWTPLPFVADTFYGWTKELPPSGSLFQLITKEGETSITLAS